MSCIFCKKVLKPEHVLKHEDNCVKQFKTLIGPDYEKVKCECNRVFYKDDVIKWEYRKNVLEKRIYYGIQKHLRICSIYKNADKEGQKRVRPLQEVFREPSETPDQVSLPIQ